MTRRRRSIIFWILLSVAILTALANLPTMYSASRFSAGTFFDLWRIAPNQFLFDALFVPIAAYMVGCALWWSLRAARGAKVVGQSLPIKVLMNWPVVFLVSIAMAALVSAAFYVSSAFSPDKLQGQYADYAVQSVNVIEAKIHNASSDAQRAQIAEGARTARERVATLNLSPQNVSSTLPGLSTAERAQVLLSKDRQRDLALLDETATAVSAFQVFAVLAMAALLLATTLMIFMLGRAPSSSINVGDLDRARLAAFMATVAFIPYPYFFGLYRSQIERVTGANPTGSQDLVATIMILLVLLFLAFSQRAVDLKSLDAIRALAAGLIVIFPAVSSRIGIGSPLRSLIGVQSNVGTYTVLLIASGTAFLPFILMVLPEV